MIPYDLDPSLHATLPLPAQLEDGFSPPHEELGDGQQPLPSEATAVTIDPALQAKSPF
ncbi:MAG TPA: hypothetical protein VLJ58_15650 [Ramlibacter sp.]|nr:hypothetical protein [Ramlibacter sp.]